MLCNTFDSKQETRDMKRLNSENHGCKKYHTLKIETWGEGREWKREMKEGNHSYYLLTNNMNEHFEEIVNEFKNLRKL